MPTGAESMATNGAAPDTVEAPRLEESSQPAQPEPVTPNGAKPRRSRKPAGAAPEPVVADAAAAERPKRTRKKPAEPS